MLIKYKKCGRNKKTNSKAHLLKCVVCSRIFCHLKGDGYVPKTCSTSCKKQEVRIRWQKPRFRNKMAMSSVFGNSELSRKLFKRRWSNPSFKKKMRKIWSSEKHRHNLSVSLKKAYTPGSKLRIMVAERNRLKWRESFYLRKRKFLKFLKTKEITLLSDYLGTLNTKYKFRCNKGHEWETFGSILAHKGGLCPVCKNYKSEEKVRSIIECITGHKFPKTTTTTLPWLHGLYLDGYCNKLKNKGRSVTTERK